MEAGQGEQFMAVRPYEGAIFEPTNRNVSNLLFLIFYAPYFMIIKI